MGFSAVARIWGLASGFSAKSGVGNVVSGAAGTGAGDTRPDMGSKGTPAGWFGLGAGSVGGSGRAAISAVAADSSLATSAGES